MTKEERQLLIGTQLKQSRLRKKLTQSKLAESIELSRTYLSDIENGRYMPSVEVLSLLACKLDMDLNFLTSMTEIQVNKSPQH